MDRLTRYTLGIEPERIKVIRPLAGWGPWKALQGTEFESLVPRVSIDAHHHAVYGWMNPIRKELGNPPEAILKKIQTHPCNLSRPEDCRIATPWCHPCKKVPICYEFPHDNPDVGVVMTYLVRHWAEGYWCFVLEEP